jgi:hypothetical protein
VTITATSVPFDQTVTGGVLQLPVDTDTQAATLTPEMASLRACVVPGRVKDGVEGGVVGPPVVDCSTASTATFTPARGSAGAIFTIDLAPFARLLSLGSLSLALVPGENPGTAWHVAFLRSDQPAGTGGIPINAVLTVGIRSPDVIDTPVTSDVPQAAPNFGPTSGLPPVTSGSVSVPGPQAAPETITPSVAGLQSAPRTLVLTPAAAVRRTIWSPLLFLLPLVGLAALAWTCRVFSRDLLPVRD